MTLSEWAAQHPDEIRADETYRPAARALAAVVAREVTDAEGVPSDDGRLEHAFAACLAAARAALAANGYRLRSSAHHYLAVESLRLTLGLPEEEVQRLQIYRRMRARAMYEQVGIASPEDARSALATARAVADRLRAWLTGKHPDLLPG